MKSCWPSRQLNPLTNKMMDRWTAEGMLGLLDRPMDDRWLVGLLVDLFDVWNSRRLDRHIINSLKKIRWLEDESIERWIAE